jgi:hypothetical protein
MRETPSAEIPSTDIPPAPAAATARRALDLVGRRVVVAADGEGALDAVLALLPFARQVTLVHAEDGVAGRAVRAAADALLLRVVRGAVEAVERDGERVRTVHVATPVGPLRLAADELLTLADVAAVREVRP